MLQGIAQSLLQFGGGDTFAGMIIRPAGGWRDKPAITRHATDVMPGPRDSVTHVVGLAAEAALAQTATEA